MELRLLVSLSIHLRCLLLAVLCGLPVPLALAQEQQQEPPDLSGKLVSIGSDTLGSLSSVWAEALSRRYPRVVVQVRAVGSGAAPPALIQGTADVGPMSRRMSPEEYGAFIKRYGYPPTAIQVAQDSLAVFVHRNNPLDSIRLSQLDAVFSITRRCGYAEALPAWSGLGLRGEWADRLISMYGRSTASGTYSFFRKEVLCSGDFSPYLNRLVGSSAVVRAVSRDRDGIGYASAGYVNENVKRLRVLANDGVEEVDLSRGLFLYVNRERGVPLEPVIAAFVDIVLSDTGQREVARAGYLPLSLAERERLRERLDLPGA